MLVEQPGARPTRGELDPELERPALRPVDAWGSIAGGLTSSAALQTVRRAADSNEAATAYAAAYAVGSVLATITAPLLVLGIDR